MDGRQSKDMYIGCVHVWYVYVCVVGACMHFVCMCGMSMCAWYICMCICVVCAWYVYMDVCLCTHQQTSGQQDLTIQLHLPGHTEKKAGLQDP